MIKKVTIQDIAAELELSRNTVAKALMNSETVAYDTRMTVIKKAWKMGYQKLNASILEEYKLADGADRTRTVMILARRELSVFWNSIIVGISDELNRNNCRMRLNFISTGDELSLTLPRDFDGDIDAVILMSVFEPKFTELILRADLPTVFLDCPIGRYNLEHNCDSIVTEGKASVAALTSSLIGQGMTRIGFIGDITYCESLRQRYSGFCTSMSEAGIMLDPEIVFTSRLPENYSPSEVENIVNDFPYVPDAVVCANDDIALKCIRAYIRKGIKCPDDIAITGFDNEEVLTQAEPWLTTVSVRNQMLGKRLVRQLMWRMENPDFPRETVSIATEPIYRRSSVRNVRH